MEHETWWWQAEACLSTSRIGRLDSLPPPRFIEIDRLSGLLLGGLLALALRLVELLVLGHRAALLAGAFRHRNGGGGGHLLFEESEIVVDGAALVRLLRAHQHADKLR